MPCNSPYHIELIGADRQEVEQRAAAIRCLLGAVRAVAAWSALLLREPRPHLCAGSHLSTVMQPGIWMLPPLGTDYSPLDKGTFKNLA
jgi:hypothetical protein